MVNDPNRSFVMLSLKSTIKIFSKIISDTENIPPVRSIKTLKIDHPKVDFLFLFHSSWGIYFNREHMSL